MADAYTHTEFDPLSRTYSTLTYNADGSITHQVWQDCQEVVDAVRERPFGPGLHSKDVQYIGSLPFNVVAEMQSQGVPVLGQEGDDKAICQKFKEYSKLRGKGKM